MKKIFLRYMLIAGLAILTACTSDDEFLKENLYGKLFPESFYNNKDELELANNSLYRSLSKAFHAYYTTFLRVLYSGDDITSPLSQQDVYIYSAADEDMRGGWEKAYEGINKANGIIENYARATGLTDEQLGHYAGQAHFVRAYLYFWLTRIYNEIPYVSTVRVSDRTITLSSSAEVYDHIVADLKIAEELLPMTWDGIDQMKHNGAGITKGAAKATLASVYLFMAGYPVMGGSLGINECYRLAKDKAAEIINNEASYGYDLLDHCDELWRVRPKLNKEMVFALVYDGVEDYNVNGPTYCRPMELGGWGGLCSEINFYLRFPEGERKDATYLSAFPMTPDRRAVLPWPDGQPLTYWQDISNWRPFYNKMWDCEGSEGETKWVVPSGIWRSDRTNAMIRYPEVLLIYAEAQAMADGGPNELAYNCLDRVRNRAFKGKGSTENNIQRSLSAEAFRDSVFVERGWEFAGLEYCSRWFDLVRREFVEDAIKVTPDHSFLPGRNPSDGAPIRPPSKPESYFHPRPEEDALLNPNII